MARLRVESGANWDETAATADAPRLQAPSGLAGTGRVAAMQQARPRPISEGQ